MSPGLSRFVPAPWVFVLTGIIFNILSAVITHYSVGLNNDEITRIDTQIKNQQVLIDSLWQSKTEIERKQEFFILFLTTVDSQSPTAAQIYDRFFQHLKNLVEVNDLLDFDQFNKLDSQQIANHSSEVNLKYLLDIGADAQQRMIQSINDTYFEILDLESQKLPIEKSNTRLYSIAIFLQVIGLILVLARDLKRH